MAIAARRPAPPPPTSTMSGEEVTARGRGAGDEGSAMLGDELVHQDGAVVADQFSAHAAIVVLVPHAPAAAGVVPAVTDQALFVLVLAVLPVGHPSTGSPFAVEACGRGNHRSPSIGDGRADRPPARGIGRMCACEPMGASSTISTFPARRQVGCQGSAPQPRTA